MKKAYLALSGFILATLTACGSNFEWFPKVADTTAPDVSWTYSGNGTVFRNNTTLTAPKTISITAVDSSIPVSIYYTTNGVAPTSASNLYTAPISVTNASWILQFFGQDHATPTKNSSSVITLKFR